MPAYAWLGAIIFLLMYEFAAIGFHSQTLSQWVWQTSDHFWWFKWVTFAWVGSLMWHFFGSSWWIGRG